ncbi:saccharopine dehydrogenase-like oxidoreductase isoform X2 [Homarus americanus]|uniref:Saccharopine dehydrogenase-like oxidoreductase-like n=2 Tax=Homarus americanus TaxID=6706 RepID=A0A8J5MQ17_HOMAM|nr:saccharopine dehydrogenase-like oxidoreductase isoform X2 [Homarus americanus]XP_042238868.1 saccharopine dehydrogenase-like oxidoreductase isoform X2 [Homarus americanus]XP_042238870.1 saccharopine dehydrogenase-like oxidoreductase isoform X2 [Homarus americanus]XP_042238871.1 saccharopine dehydrogenase-like oxidoreductase isoform X2 [Homarus americanus]XP_042238872.1 saccharopine dehydrogenase-like oxidoreductase isoform X2 [Homarus americanus]XP_042238873.1 saccharopine dehydrogenase-lik
MASLASGQRYDLVVFGATGFTGQYVVEEVSRVAQQEGTERKIPLSWAVAGRSKDKLMKTLAAATKETGLNLEEVGVILADTSDQESLNKMASQSNVVINCVGPYQLYGEPVVRACVEAGANHVDISGEPQFLERMQLKYNKAAEEAGVHIVGACGYDSIPAEMGLVHMAKNFKGELNSAEMFVTVKGKGAVHTGTLESAALAVANQNEIARIRQELFSESLPKPKHKITKKGALHKNDKLGLWGVPLPTDEPVVYRTQRYWYDVLKKRPIQFQQFIGIRSFFQGVGTLLGLAYFALLCYFSWTRHLLLKYPEVLTAGMFRRAGADREELRRMKFTATLIGHGWSQPLAEGCDQHVEAPDSSIVVKVTGPDPGYGATSLMLVSSAMSILREKNLCTGKGGVMTPGAAFANTKLIELMVDRGMTFTALPE